MSDKEEYSSLKVEIDALKTKRQQLVKEFFNKQSKSLFDKYPNLESFGFKCYAPYFCDGDPCEFGVHYDKSYGLKINGLEGEELGEDKVINGKYEFIPADQWEKEMINEVHTFLKSIDTDDYEEMFGNDVEVTVTKTGVEIESYTDHD
jgi:hypothetical protein